MYKTHITYSDHSHPHHEHLRQIAGSVVHVARRLVY